MGTTIRETVVNVAADVLSVSPELLSEHSSPKTVENWDSVRQLNLVLALEDRFAVQFAPEEMEQMESVGQITALVETKLAKAGKS